MFNLRFPFSFFQSPNNFPTNFPRRTAAAAVLSAAAAAAAAAGAASIAVSCQNSRDGILGRLLPNGDGSPFPLWGSLSLSDNAAASLTEARTGVEFPSIVGESRKLLGVGVRRKSVLGLKNIDVYAFGIYADDSDVKKLLKEKYSKEGNVLTEDLVESDVCMTVRLQIVYGRLSIKSVRSAFEESVGTRLRKFSGEDNKELLHRFTSLFKDEYKIPRGSVIDLSRDRGYVLRTTIDGKDVGTIESKVLCRSILDLYVGDDPFDQNAREDVQRNVAALLEI